MDQRERTSLLTRESFPTQSPCPSPTLMHCPATPYSTEPHGVSLVSLSHRAYRPTPNWAQPSMEDLGSVARKSQMDSVTRVPGVTRVPSTMIVTAPINITNMPTQETNQRPIFQNTP